MKNLSFLFALVLSFTFMTATASAQTKACCANKTACVKPASSSSSAALVPVSATTATKATASTTPTTNTKLATAQSATQPNRASDVPAITSKPANCDPKACEPKNCDPAACKDKKSGAQ